MREPGCALPSLMDDFCKWGWEVLKGKGQRRYYKRYWAVCLPLWETPASDFSSMWWDSHTWCKHETHADLITRGWTNLWSLHKYLSLCLAFCTCTVEICKEILFRLNQKVQSLCAQRALQRLLIEFLCQPFSGLLPIVSLSMGIPPLNWHLVTLFCLFIGLNMAFCVAGFLLLHLLMSVLESWAAMKISMSC